MNMSFGGLIRVFRNEVYVHRNAVVWLFIAISFSTMFLGAVWPKKYQAASIILVDQRKIIQPLIEGVAVATEVKDFADMAKELIYGRKIMNTILEKGGWLKGSPSPAEKEQLIKDLKERTQISPIKSNLIKIEYKDTDPIRAADTANHFAELLLAESTLAKGRESGTAFEFLNRQVQEYHQKLVRADTKLQEFRSQNIEALPNTQGEISARVAEIRSSLEKTKLDLTEAFSRKELLEKQLAGEIGVTTNMTREAQYQVHLAELQAELDKLRLSYHDTHPNVIKIKHQMEDLAEAIASEKQRRETTNTTATQQEQPFADRGIYINPIYGELRREILATKTTIDALKLRIAELERRLREELERWKRVPVSETILAELTRDYEVNRDIYQRLLRRREQARVSANIDQQEQGLNLRVQERATASGLPSGPRFLHFVVVSFALGVLVPLGSVYIKVLYDPRIRFESAISEKLNLSVLAVIPHLSTPRESLWVAWNKRLLVIIVLIYLGAFAYICWLKATGMLTIELEDILKLLAFTQAA